MSSNTQEHTDFLQFLDNSLEEVIRQADLPVKLKNGNFRFQKYLVKRDHKADRFEVIFLPTRTTISRVFLKTSAFIIVNKHKARQNFSRILELDSKFVKNYIDCQFFKYTVKHTKEDLKRESAMFRFEICADRALDCKEAIEDELRAYMR